MLNNYAVARGELEIDKLGMFSEFNGPTVYIHATVNNQHSIDASPYQSITSLQIQGTSSGRITTEVISEVASEYLRVEAPVPSSTLDLCQKYTMYGKVFLTYQPPWQSNEGFLEIPYLRGSHCD